MTPAELDALLAWPDSRPPIFAEHRSLTGNSEWHEDSKVSESAGEKQPLKLLWHQMCGVAAIVDKLWTSEEGKIPGILLADAVGIGKTAQIMAVIAINIQIWMAEQRGKEGKTERRPQIIGGG
jgi:hypothetical protein